jgi:hypothetical protein
MPGMTGLEFAKVIRDKVAAPIIIYTGQGSEEVAEAAFNIGIDDYIRKEIDPSHYQLLTKHIKVAVYQRRTEQLYLRVVEDTRDAIAADGIIAFAKKALADILGFNVLLPISTVVLSLVFLRWGIMPLMTIYDTSLGLRGRRMFTIYLLATQIMIIVGTLTLGFLPF